ncbi:Hypothetical protein P9303_27431 [Prochlorococcus marinus str. MIT 9303]|uniref:Uncharacterized protein n=1 Tax=Prochlorococcus marinus (strain MIT 9303) TaxID=59922 RepID=A2CDB3_PROM3|nr:Hypothetical protein P9303_27431 [Prochlorococcus marinus str. MIT 9303]
MAEEAEDSTKPTAEAAERLRVLRTFKREGMSGSGSVLEVSSAFRWLQSDAKSW